MLKKRFGLLGSEKPGKTGKVWRQCVFCKKVFVADDNEMNLDVLQKILMKYLK